MSRNSSICLCCSATCFLSSRICFGTGGSVLFSASVFELVLWATAGLVEALFWARAAEGIIMLDIISMVRKSSSRAILIRLHRFETCIMISFLVCKIYIGKARPDYSIDDYQSPPNLEL